MRGGGGGGGGRKRNAETVAGRMSRRKGDVVKKKSRGRGVKGSGGGKLCVRG